MIKIQNDRKKKCVLCKNITVIKWEFLNGGHVVEC